MEPAMDPEKNLQKSVPVKDGALQEKNSCNNNLGESRGENASRKGKCFANCCTSLSDFIVSILERAFYSLGKIIGKQPWAIVSLSFIFAGLCAVGMIKFAHENRNEKLWNAKDSLAQKHKKWVEDKFPSKAFVSTVLFTSDDVLTPEVMNAALQVRKKVLLIYNGTDISWEKICYRPGRSCLTSDLLEIWEFNETVIKSLTKRDILKAINKPNVLSPVTGRRILIERLLGKIKRNDTDDSIIGARALSANYFIKNQEVYNPKSGKREDRTAKKWETEFARIFQKKISDKAKTLYLTKTAFDKAANDSIQDDFPLLFSGYCLMLCYLTIMLGKFTKLHQKAWLALVGVACVGMSIMASFGLSSAFGYFYGPLHSILPFLILGIGLDNVFVIVQTWNVVIESAHPGTSVPVIIAKTLKHAGVAITVTSMTDIMAFFIGATTFLPAATMAFIVLDMSPALSRAVLPALESFCVFAGVGIFITFIFACTTFTACLTLDTKRLNDKKDACCCCVRVPDDYRPSTCATRDYLQLVFNSILAKFLLKRPIKVIVLLMTIGLFAAGTYGLYFLKQDFDFNRFLPKESAAKQYLKAKAVYFPSEGAPGAVYTGNADYFKEQANLHQLYRKIKNNGYVSEVSVHSWYENYLSWINKTKGNISSVDENFRPKNETNFYNWLIQFLNSRQGHSFMVDVLLVNTSNSWKIEGSRIHFTHIDMDDAQKEVKAMDSLTSDVESVPIRGMKPFPYSQNYVWWETNKIIRVELFRNLGLVGACVFFVTVILIANLWTSLMVFTCVIFTLVDVAGMMHFWGLTVDTVTSVLLILSTGLCVDYAAHIGHSFMTSRLGNKNERAASALSDIGPAVFNGGVSTFLAIILLSFSESYAFIAFFKVFFLVVLFGQFHGLIYFPVLLSLIGPKSYSSVVPGEVSGASVDPLQEKPYLINARGTQVLDNNGIIIQNLD